MIAFALLAASCLCWLSSGCVKVNDLIFQPPPARYADGRMVKKAVTSDGRKVSFVHLENPASRFVILYSHGNAEDLGTVIGRLAELREMGYSVVGYDYGGYGTSEGVPNEAGSYADIDAVYRYLTETLAIPPRNIVLYGFSLGGGVATDLASRKPVGGLVLESTFVSAFRVVTRYKLLPFDRFRSLAKIESVKCPVLVMHGDADRVIPEWHGRKLFDSAKSPKYSLWVPGAGHGDLSFVAGPKYRETFGRFVSSL